MHAGESSSHAAAHTILLCVFLLSELRLKERKTSCFKLPSNLVFSSSSEIERAQGFEKRNAKSANSKRLNFCLARSLAEKHFKLGLDPLISNQSATKPGLSPFNPLETALSFTAFLIPQTNFEPKTRFHRKTIAEADIFVAIVFDSRPGTNGIFDNSNSNLAWREKNRSRFL